MSNSNNYESVKESNLMEFLKTFEEPIDDFNIDEFYNDPDFLEFLKTPEEEASDDFNRSEFIFAKDVRRSLNDYKTRLNNNVLILGTSGCGKTTSFLEPNLKTAVGNYIVSDPKGSLIKKYGKYMEKNGYRVMRMDFQNPEKSMHWNPLTNVESTQDIMRIASSLTYQCENIGINGDPYWDQMTLLLICALIGYMKETDFKPCNFDGLMQLLREGNRFSRRTLKNGERSYNDKASLLSDRFEQLHEKNPESWAYEQFRNVDQAPEKTYDCIRSCLAAKFSNYTTKEIEAMMSENDIDFAELAQEKFVIFVLQSDCDRSMDGLVNMFFSQAINSLFKYSDTCKNQRLPIPVRFFLDDYGATTAIDNLDTIISTIRSRGISVSLILQSEAQLLKGKSGTDKTIIANCDTYIYMGGNDVETAQAVSVRCNKPLEQILFMPIGHCWVFERGSKPVYTEIAERPDFEEERIL